MTSDGRVSGVLAVQRSKREFQNQHPAPSTAHLARKHLWSHELERATHALAGFLLLARRGRKGWGAGETMPQQASDANTALMKASPKKETTKRHRLLASHTGGRASAGSATTTSLAFNSGDVEVMAARPKSASMIVRRSADSSMFSVGDGCTHATHVLMSHDARGTRALAGDPYLASGHDDTRQWSDSTTAPASAVESTIARWVRERDVRGTPG